MKFFFLVVVFCSTTFGLPSGMAKSRPALTIPISARNIIEKTFTSIEKIKTLKYNLKCIERISGKLMNTESVVKLQRSPRKLYLYLKGAELLWVQGENNNLALINPGGFPYFNMNFDPEGSVMRKDQHHTLHEMGFDYFSLVLKEAVKSLGEKFDNFFILNGEEKANNRDCYKITILNPDFSFIDYTVLKSENMITIARKLNVSEYMILENNPQHSSYHGLKEGEKIKVPTCYAKMTIVYVDKQYFLPIANKVYDDKGLFEEYYYNFLQVNPKIADEEFTRDYKDYHF